MKKIVGVFLMLSFVFGVAKAQVYYPDVIQPGAVSYAEIHSDKLGIGNNLLKVQFEINQNKISEAQFWDKSSQQ